MHITIPTIDLVFTLSRLKPIKSIVTYGAMFSVYTLEAYDNKLKIIASDGSSFTASTEVFAKVKTPGRVSVNGNDFFTSMLSLSPAQKKGSSGSDEIEIKVDRNKLKIKTHTCYTEVNNAKVKQSRDFSLVRADLAAKDTKISPEHNLVISGEYLFSIFKIMTRMISAYTSDIAGLSGVLLRARNDSLVFVVSDGTRLLEVNSPFESFSSDFDVIIPKTTCLLIQSLIGQGDIINIYCNKNKIKLITEQDGLRTTLVSSVIPDTFPEYTEIFKKTGPNITINPVILKDNITNVRKSLHDDTYKLAIDFNGKTLSLSNKHSSSHLEFINDDIPVISCEKDKFSVLVNAFLLESLLSLMGQDDLSLTVPADNKPIIISSTLDDAVIRAALGVVE